MAEGWARHLKGESMVAYSAGTSPHGLNPLAVKVMAEAGVDISRQQSKHVAALRSVPLDFVISVCDSAREACPVFPGRVRTIHRGFDDPPALAKNAAGEAEALGHYRRVRDEIRAFIESLPDALTNQQPGEQK